jgi:hypothetical protein
MARIASDDRFAVKERGDLVQENLSRTGSKVVHFFLEQRTAKSTTVSFDSARMTHSTRESRFPIWKSKLTACTIDSAYSGKDNVLRSLNNLTEVPARTFRFLGEA